MGQDGIQPRLAVCAFEAGFGSRTAFITPCIYPVVPLPMMILRLSRIRSTEQVDG